MSAPRRAASWCRRATSQPASPGVFCTASTAAQRTSVEPCLSVAVGTFKRCPPWVMHFFSIVFAGGGARRSQGSGASLKELGESRVVGDRDWGFFASGQTGRRGRRGARARAKRDREAAVGPWGRRRFGRGCGRRGRRLDLAPWGLVGVGRCAHQGRCPGWSAGRGGLP